MPLTWQPGVLLVKFRAIWMCLFSSFKSLHLSGWIPKAQNTVSVSWLWWNCCLQILIYNKALEFHYFLMLFTRVGVGNCCSLRNANAEGSCQALIRVKGVHRSDLRLKIPPDRPHATPLPTARWWVWETARRPPRLRSPLSTFPTPVLFCLTFARMSKGSVLEAFHSQPSPPLRPFSPPASLELFFF